MRRKHVDGGARKEDSEGRCPVSCFPLVEQPTHGFTSRGRGRQTGRFDELKSFKRQRYSGMAIGGTHHWVYESGRCDETKEEPDLWKVYMLFEFALCSRRNVCISADQVRSAETSTEACA